MGRRFEKKVSIDGEITQHERYLYRGYLQITALDLLTNTTKHAILWDPTQPTATRPLAIQQGKAWYTYAWDLTKNITALFTSKGALSTTYTYTPFGKVSVVGDVTQSIQWSSEYHDTELGLIYYNYRYYNPQDGRWTRRDPLGTEVVFLSIVGEENKYDILCSLYKYNSNDPTSRVDRLGLSSQPFSFDVSSTYCNGVLIASYSPDLKYKIKGSSWKKMALDGILGLIAGQLAGLPGTQVSAALRGTKTPVPFAYLVYACSCPTNPDLNQKDIVNLGLIDVRYISNKTSEAQNFVNGKDEYYKKECPCEEESK